MITLYDLLGADQADDPETLKNAFRNAVKTSHPDLRGGDPAAAARFRNIVRANAILSDPEQRALYDQLLEFERWKSRPRTKRGIVLDVLRSLVTDAVTVVLLAGVLVSAYLGFMHLSKTSVAAGEAKELATPARSRASFDATRSDFAAAWRQMEPQGSPIKLSREELHELLTGPAPAPAEPSPTVAVTEAAPAPAPVAPDEPIAAEAPTAKEAAAEVPTAKEAAAEVPAAKEAAAEAPASNEGAREEVAMAPSAAVVAAKNADDDRTQQNEVSAPPIAARSEADVTPSSRPTDPKFYRERGAAFYHSGDLDRALADFSAAIALDPHSPSAYTDRSIVYYRKGEIALAFADLVEASRLEDSLDAAARPHRAGAAAPHK